MKYTVVYNEYWASGSHQHVITKMRRVEKHETETVKDMLVREELMSTAVLIFEGHSKMEGEE